MQRILAIGGFSTGESEAIAAGYIRKLAGKQTPSICLLSTPAGDPPLLIRNFEETYGRFGFKTSNVSFFSQATTNTVKPEVAAAHLLKQDAIFVSGGNARCAVALWTEWGITAALKEAWNRGILLSGMSAGAVCWFEHNVPPTSIETNVPLQRFLGFLEGACAVHYDARREDAQKTMRSIALNSVVAIDDDAAILYEGTDLVEVLSWREGATAYRLKRDSDEIHEHSLSAKIIGSLPVKAAREPVLVEVESKRACVGRYELTNPMQVSFTMEGEQLFAQYGAQPKLPIFPQSETEYFWTVVDAQVTFQKDSNGHVTSFVHHQNGRDTSGVRVAD